MTCEKNCLYNHIFFPGVFCAAVVNANHHGFNGGGYYPYYSDGYVVQHRPLLGGLGGSVVEQRPLLRGPVEQRPLLRGPGGSVIFSGTGMCNFY